jgi:hypothetical protein
MTAQTSSRRRWPTAVLVAASALAIGSIFGVPGIGQAASEAVPANTALPTISGTAQAGSTLATDNGTWSGSPTGFVYAWSRCTAGGGTCLPIAGATAQAYQVQAADVGLTLRASVTATNADGTTSATSAATAIVLAAPAVGPVNTAPPTISGTVQVGSTLTAATGTWSGSPTGYAYAWSRCDQSGNNCAAISGATSSTYVLQQVDAGTTLRVAVTATNASGSNSVTSAQTAVVPAVPVPPATGCPTGTGVVAIGDVSSPARLLIDSQTVTPGVVTPSANTLDMHFRVTACGGRPVQGALVYATAIPYNQYSIAPEATTGADGSANLTMTQRTGFPAARHQQLLVVFARARKPGEPITGGISSRRLVSFPVSLHG